MKEWSVYVYICSDMPDMDLVNAAIADVNHIREAGSSDKVGVVAQVDLPVLPTKRYVFPPRSSPKNPTIEVTELDRNINTADPASIVEFFEWANHNAPAKNVFLIIWGHGFGIDDFNPFPAGMDQLGRKTGSQEWGSFPDCNGNVFPLNRAPIRDATAGTPKVGRHAFLRNSQVGAAVKRCRKILQKGQNLSILGFDACDMSLLEVWFEMDGAADIGIGSQFGVPFKGWPYREMLKYLVDHPATGPEELAARVVREFADFNDGNAAKPVVTLSACDLRRAEMLAKPIRELTEELAQVSESESARAKIFDARNQSPIFDQDGFVDVGSFCRHLQVNFPNAKIAALAEDVCQEIGRYVLDRSFAPKDTAKKISRSTGVSLWFPPWIQHPDIEFDIKVDSVRYFRQRYSATRFARLTGWDGFLKTILRNMQYDSQCEEAMMANSDADRAIENAGTMGHDEPMGRLVTMGHDEPMGKASPFGNMERSPEADGARVFLNGSSRAAGVVVRATVESFGPVGETELNVTVKWPAGGNSSPVVEPVRRAVRPPGAAPNVK